MKTAIEELIHWMEKNNYYATDVYYTAINLIEIEHKQITAAFSYAYLIGEDDVSNEQANREALEYFIETHK